jgi:hypothetical protein
MTQDFFTILTIWLIKFVNVLVEMFCRMGLHAFLSLASSQ